MSTKKSWTPGRGDIIQITGVVKTDDLHAMLVLSHEEFNAITGTLIGLLITTDTTQDSNPFALKIDGPRGISGFVLAHQPITLNWRNHDVAPHSWKYAPHDVLTKACSTLNQIIEIGE